jgi:hypothetical protein
MVPIAYLYDWLSGIIPTGTIAMSSLPSALNFYPEFNVLYVPGLLFDFVVKIPFLISDILVALLLYKTVEAIMGNKGVAEKAALLWFLNPMVIWISAGWGMWDTLPVLFSLACFYFLAVKKKFALSAVCLSLGVAAKLYPLLFLVPIGFYLLKVSDPKRLKNSIRFYGVFALASALLFLPYFSSITGFAGTVLPIQAAVNNAVADPIVHPVGFGLTFWSIFLLNRFVSIPVTADFVTFLSFFSVALMASSLLFVYWKTSKLNFKKPALDLMVAFLLPLVAFFVSYRIICEQWFIWVLPPLILLCVSGLLRRVHYWLLSFMALAYAVLNCPLPFFFLPLATWFGNSLLGMVHAALSVEPVRIGLLVSISWSFSILLILSVRRSKKSTFD